MTAKRGADDPTTDDELDGTTLADRRTFIKGVGATAATLATTGAASAQETTTADGPEWTMGRDGLAWSSDYVQNGYIEENDLVRARHRMEWGADDDALTAYEDD
ncbi:twin-arginine translocation signal domain-containing protein, partial [Actinoplanes utahensis]